ncbi:hypothetical protein WJX74_006345 [Apatococcus lobatus]|uniref:Uncharacterized protein n=1 Tax=Apatococcus lobatus TaxID=904363 RepID=A0AAW1QKB2_9CHLO
MRASYGGMAGDVSMLHEYTRLWHSRFGEAQNRPVASNVAAEAPSEGATHAGIAAADQTWLSLIRKLYHLVRIGHPVQDVSQIGPVRIGDIPTAAIDFHVSDIAEEVTAFSTSSPQGPATTAALLKKAMWQCSSGVTTKTPFDWSAGWDCILELQSAIDNGSPQELASRMHARTQAHCNVDPELQRVWLKEAAAVSTWAHRYLGKRFH